MIDPAVSETPSSNLATIVITTRDRPGMARRALRSALAQSVPPSQVVIVDDASDPPFELQDADARVSVVRLSSSRGVSAARNAGLARATGEWVAFLDDDDELLPDMLERSLRAAARSTLPPPVAVLGGVETVRADGSTEATRFPRSMPRGMDYFLDGAPVRVGNSLVVPRDVLVRLGGFDDELRSAEHSELLLRLNATCSIEGLPVVTYRINRHHLGHIHGDPLARARAMDRTERKHRLAFVRHPRRHAEYLAAIGIWYLRAGRWGPAVRPATRALATDPWNGKVAGSWLVVLGGPASLALYRRIVRPLRDRGRRRT